MPNVIGIDLGTTFSCVAVFKNGNVEIIDNEHGNSTTPSYVAFADQKRLIGDEAKNQAQSNWKNTIFDVKRLIGRKFSEKSLQDDLKHLPFEVVNEQDHPKIKITRNEQTEVYAPEEISAMVLEKMKEIAQDYLGKPVDGAVITVPAYFNNEQRQATQIAGKIADLKVMKIINEPTAAAIAYGFQSREYEASRNILVFDFGGGTLDVTVLQIEDGIYDVKSTSGDTHLGGEDFTNRMVTHVAKEIQTKLKKDVTQNGKALSRLRNACENAKRSLSNIKDSRIEIDSLIDGQDFQTSISRVKFESLNDELFQTVLKPIQTALDDANLKVSEIDDVVLVGGSTRIPKIREILSDFFKSTKINKDINPDEAVASGAAIQAAKLAGDLSEDLQEMVIHDILPLSLGLEITGGLMSVLIPRNTTIPITKSKVFTTHKDNQTTVKVQVYEGERPLTKDNNRLGEFKLTELTRSTVGQTHINVQFNIDVNGILNVTATEKNEEKGSLTINAEQRVKKEQIQEMIDRAEANREKDEKEKQRILAKVRVEGLCLKLQSEFRSPAAKGTVRGSDREKVFTIIAKALSWIDTNHNAPKEKYEKKYTEVQESCEHFRKQIYEKKKCTENEDDHDDIN